MILSPYSYMPADEAYRLRHSIAGAILVEAARCMLEDSPPDSFPEHRERWLGLLKEYDDTSLTTYSSPSPP